MAVSEHPHRMSSYRTPCGSWRGWVLQPHGRQAAYIRSLWYVRGRGATLMARLPTDGCLSIGFNLGEPTLLWQGATREAPPARLSTVWVEGLQRAHLNTATGRFTEMLGCRLTPIGAVRLFGGELPHLTETVVPGADIASLPLQALRELLLETRSVTARLHALNEFICRRIRGSQHADRRLAHAVERLSSTQGEDRISTVAAAVGLSRSRFTHWFRERLGVTPKQLRSIGRFCSTSGDIQRDREVDWCELAFRHGYYDQSHLIREFKAKLGMTPGDYRRRLDTLSQSVAILDEACITQR